MEIWFTSSSGRKSCPYQFKGEQAGGILSSASSRWHTLPIEWNQPKGCLRALSHRNRKGTPNYFFLHRRVAQCQSLLLLEYVLKHLKRFKPYMLIFTLQAWKIQCQSVLFFWDAYLSTGRSSTLTYWKRPISYFSACMPTSQCENGTQKKGLIIMLFYHQRYTVKDRENGPNCLMFRFSLY